MASNTERLKLLKKDPLTDGNETFNIQTMLNDNWDKLDEAVGSLQDEIANLDPDIPEGSTTQKGVVQLSSATNSTSETLAATPKAVKAAFDLANSGQIVRGNAPSDWNNATQNGLYRVAADNLNATYANASSGAYGYGVLEVIYGVTSGSATAQRYQTHDGRLYYRTAFAGGNWSAWKDVVTYSLTDVNGRAKNITGQDLNNITIGGFYNGSNLVNAPDSTSWWYIEVIAHTNTNGYTLQKAYMLNGGVRVMKMRTQEGGTWSPWSQVITSDGGTINGGVTVNGGVAAVGDGGNILDMAGSTHAYMEIYPGRWAQRVDWIW